MNMESVKSLPMPAVAVGTGISLLVVVAIIGIVLTITMSSNSPPFPNPSDLKNPSKAPFMQTLMANPVQGIVLAYTKHTIPAVIATVFLWPLLRPS